MIPLLEKQGYQCHVLDLPGSGEDTTDLSLVSLDLYADKIIDVAKQIHPERKILIGHSMGGVAITAAANKAPELFDQLICVCAFLPQDGESVFSLSHKYHNPEFLGPQIKVINNGLQSELLQEPIADTFFNDTKQVTKYIEQFKPQALGIGVSYSSWYRAGNKMTDGAQIDLLLDRSDDTIHICEIKFSAKQFIIDKRYSQLLQQK